MKVYKKLLPIFAIIVILLSSLFANISFNVKAQSNYRTYYFSNVNIDKFFMGYNPTKSYYLHTNFLNNDEYLIILFNGNLMIFKKSSDTFINLVNVSLSSVTVYGLFKYNNSYVGVYGAYGSSGHFKVYLISLIDYTIVGTNELGGFDSAIYLCSYGFVHYFVYTYYSNGVVAVIVKLEGTNLVGYTAGIGGSANYIVSGYGYFNPSSNRLYVALMKLSAAGNYPDTVVLVYDASSNTIISGSVSKNLNGVYNGKFLSYGIYLSGVQILGSTYYFYLSVTGTWKMSSDSLYSTKDSIVTLTFKDNGNSVSDVNLYLSNDFIVVQSMSFAGSYPVWDCVYSFYFYDPTKSYAQVIRNNTKTSADFFPIDVPNLSLTYPFWFNSWGFAQLLNNNNDIKLYIVSGGSPAITVTPKQTVTTSTSYYPTTTYYTTQPFTTPEANTDFLTNAIIPLTIVSIPALLLAVYLGSAGLIVGLLLGGGILFYSGYAPFGLIFLIVLGAAIILWRSSSGKGGE